MRLALAALAFSLAAGAARAQDVGVFQLFVNLQPKGDIFARQEAVGDYWVKTDDLQKAGLTKLSGETRTFGGVPHVRLRTLKDVTLDVDSSELTISISVKPEALGTQTFDMGNAPPLKVSVPNRSNAHWNYRLGYEDVSGQEASRTLENLVNLWHRGWLFNYQDSYQSDLPDHRYVRQSTNLVYDWPERMQRLNIGDVIALSGELGTTRNIGGIGFSRVFDMQPNFVSNPTARFLGTVSLPSTAEIYVDGVRVGTQRLNPGVYQFNNLDYYGGLRNTEVVIRDQYGNRQVLSRNYYFTDQLLRAGLQDYSYNFGVERENVGTRSNDYSGAAYSVYHRYGVNDSLTVGARADGDREAGSIGPVAGVSLFGSGVLGASWSVRRNNELDQTGQAWVARYSFDSRHWSARAQWRQLDREYSVAAAEPNNLALPKLDTLVGAGYNSDKWGNLSYDVSRSSLYDGSYRNAQTLGYSLDLLGAVQVFASLSRVRQNTGDGWEGFAGVSINWAGGHSASVSRQKFLDSPGVTSLEVARSAPEGEGYGYRAAVNRTKDSDVVEPFGQLNTRYWTFTADGSATTRGNADSADRWGASMAGAVVFVGGQAALTRPVQGSFAAVKVGDLEGVRVYRNNQEQGRTDSRGLYVVPTVTSYTYNLLSIEPQDIDLGYEISTLEHTVVPPLGSGVLAEFEVKAIRAYEGRLRALLPRGEIAVEHVTVALKKGDATREVITGYGGEFYLKDIEPGEYEGTFALPGFACRFPLLLPESKTPTTRLDLVTVQCEPRR